MNAKIALLPGDGVGPEVIEQARRVLETVAGRFGHAFSFEEHAIGGQAMDLFEVPLPEGTAAACAEADAVLVGAVGGHKWESHKSGAAPEQGLSALKRALGLFAEVRPIRLYPELLSTPRLRQERFSGLDVLLVREANPSGDGPAPTAVEGAGLRLRVVPAREDEVRRLFHLAFRMAQGRWGLVTSVHGEVPLAGVGQEGWFGPCPIWNRVGQEVSSRFPTVKLERQHLDFAVMRLLSKPTAFDVVVADATLGRLFLEQTALLGGALGLSPCAWLGEDKRGLYQPVHGPCLDLAGKGMANPIGAILSAAMLLRYSLRLVDEAQALEAAVAATIAQGGRTVDMGGIPQFSTREMGESICMNLEQDVGTNLARLLGHWG